MAKCWVSIVRQSSQVRFTYCAFARDPNSASTKKRTGAIPVLSVANITVNVGARGASGLRRVALGAHLVHQPRAGDDEERRQEEAEQGVQPNQCDIEAPE